MPCPRCDAPLVQISIGRGLLMQSCSRCDGRWWHRDGGVVELADVLDTVGGR